MNPLPFDEDYVGQHVTAKVYPRGVAYWEDGLVIEVVRRGAVLAALVAGSEEEPYVVEVRLDEANEDEPVAESRCTCPYEWEGWCKHVVAVLLEAIHAPELVEERPPLAETLGRLKRGRLVALLLALTEAKPALTSEIERLARHPT
jgi:uncharacterized Zn finger protein